MSQSESIIKLMTALSKFQEACPVVPKNKKNHNKGFYAGLEDIMGTIRTPLREAGLVISQLPGDGTLDTLLAHFESGEFVSSTITLSAANKDNPQAVGSALTYARRYALAAVLGLPIGEEDDDAEGAIVPKPKATPKKDDLTPKHKAWGNASSYIATNGFTRDQIEAKYVINDDNWKLLVEKASEFNVSQDLKVD
jgi:hypothetical protein